MEYTTPEPADADAELNATASATDERRPEVNAEELSPIMLSYCIKVTPGSSSPMAIRFLYAS